MFAFDDAEGLTESVYQTLRQEEEQWYIDIVLDQEWLYDESRVFPVTIDPTITLTQCY